MTINIDKTNVTLHLRLNHPKSSQLKLLFEQYFFSPKTDAALLKLYSSCHLCASLQKYPKDLETFDPQLQPNHRGIAMNVDVVKRATQMILVSVDVFSFYITACLIPAERAENLEAGIIQVVTPIRRSGSILVCVDRALGFVKLASSSQSTLSDIGITLELADDANKNSNCSVDKAIDELEKEL